MLLGIRADEIVVETEDEQKTSNNVIVGIYDKSLTKRGEYRALLGINVIWFLKLKMEGKMNIIDLIKNRINTIYTKYKGDKDNVENGSKV